MKVSHSADLPTIPLPNSALSGVQLTTDKDYAKFTSYEVRIPAKTTVALRSPDGEQSVHIYYCISGKGSCVQVGSQNQREVCPDTVVALSSDVTYELTVSAEDGMRLFVVYYPDAETTYRSLAVVRGLPELVGTDRDIDWGRGHSRRYLIKEDGFPLGVHNTWVYPKTSSRMCYMNNIESVYYIAGKTTYQWQDTSGEWFHPTTKTDGGNGTNFLLDKHDRHVVQNHDEDAYCICIFDPVLTGKENHKLTDDGFSSF